MEPTLNSKLRNHHSRLKYSRISARAAATEREIDTCKLRQRIAEKSGVVEDGPKPHDQRTCCLAHWQRQNLPCVPITAFFHDSIDPKTPPSVELPKNRASEFTLMDPRPMSTKLARNEIVPGLGCVLIRRDRIL